MVLNEGTVNADGNNQGEQGGETNAEEGQKGSYRKNLKNMML